MSSLYLPPGMYSQPMSEYLPIPAVSNSVLGLLKLHAPARAKYLIDNPPPSTEAQTESTALHTAVLEPHLFDESYVVADDPCTARTQKGDSCKNAGSVLHKTRGWLCGTHARGVPEADLDTSKIVLSRKQMIVVKGASDALRRNPLVRFYLDRLSVVEQTIIGSRNGRMVKGRQDGVWLDHGICLDLKSVNGVTSKASVSEVEVEVYKRGYHRQQGLYRLIENQIGLDLPHRILVFVEKVPPYLCGVYRVLDEAVKAGGQEALALLDKYEQYEESGWPGYPASEEEGEIGLPAWGWDRIEVSDEDSL